jgi:hypothetical protein
MMPAGLQRFDPSGRVAMMTGALVPVDGGNLAFNAGGTL